MVAHVRSIVLDTHVAVRSAHGPASGTMPSVDASEPGRNSQPISATAITSRAGTSPRASEAARWELAATNVGNALGTTGSFPDQQQADE